MNIAMFAWEALEGIPVGGGAVYASRLAAALARLGHQVRLFTRLGSGQAMEEAVAGVRVLRCAWDRQPGFVDEIEALSRSFLQYFREAVKNDGRYDVIHCHDWFTLHAGLRAATLISCPLAVSIQSTEWGRTGKWPDAGDSLRIADIEREGIAAADTVIAASAWTLRTIRDQFHPPDWKCGVVYHGADLPDESTLEAGAAAIRRAAGIPPAGRSFLFAGRFSAADGADLAAHAARLAAVRFPDARFLFLGDGPLEEQMRRDAGPSALFLPLRGRVVPAEYYRGVDLVLAPFRRDHSGRAVMPAWSAGRPAVVLRGSVPAEFVIDGTNGWVTDPDPVALAAVVSHAFADPEGMVWMGQNGRVAAETAFGWDAAATRLLSLYGRRRRMSS